jgi:site-specific DNA-methyltransferase (cytosine-N4-specific)
VVELVQSIAPQSAIRGQTCAREALEDKYADLVIRRLGLRQLVTWVPNKDIPVHRWFPYKQGFSVKLVDTFLREFRATNRDRVFDPFCGCGTTILAAKERGLGAWGLDILPVAVFVSNVKLRDRGDYDMAYLRAAINRLKDIPYRRPSISAPTDVRIIQLAYTQDTLNEILFFREEIESEPDENVREFLLLGLMSILETVSFTSKDGQYLRLVNREVPPVRAALLQQLETMYADLLYPAHQLRLFERQLPTTESYGSAFPLHYVCLADARDFTDATTDYADIVMTSPPYLNRYDYSRIYSLELCLRFVNEFAELKAIRHSLLRSHIESREAPTHDVQHPALLEILQNLEGRKLNNPRIPIMIRGYFEDMNLAIRGLYEVCRKGARLALAVGNVRFGGELVPVDLLLCDLAEAAGFRVEQIIVARYKGNSSQQMGKYGRVPVRESILVWEKRG